MEMDLPVEATILLNLFHNKAEVRKILQSHDFKLLEQSSDHVRVKGSFLKLKAAKVSLEQLLDSQAKTYIMPAPEPSSGAISKYSNRNSSLKRSKTVRENHGYSSLPLPSRSTSRASPKKLPERGSSFSSRQEPRVFIRQRRESFVVDADVFVYADRLQKNDIEGIVDSYDVSTDERLVGDSYNIVVQGENAKMAASQMQNFLNDLGKSLRTQEVRLKDMSNEGRALYERIQNNQNIHDSVLVSRMDDKLHLIGPSKESYELKMKLLAEQKGKSLFRRLSLKRVSRFRQKNTARDDHIAGPDPEGAAGYSPPKQQSPKVSEFERGNGRIRLSLRGRSRKHAEEKDHEPEVEHRRQPPQSAKAFFKQLFSFKNTEFPKIHMKSKKKR